MKMQDIMIWYVASRAPKSCFIAVEKSGTLVQTIMMTNVLFFVLGVQDPENEKLENAVFGNGVNDEGIDGQRSGPTDELKTLVSHEEMECAMGMSSPELMHPRSNESDSEVLDANGELHPLVPHAVPPTGRLVGSRQRPGPKNVRVAVTTKGHRSVEGSSYAHRLAGGLQSMDEERRMSELDRLDAALIGLRTGDQSTREVLIGGTKQESVEPTG
jgi:hypothetical protein